ncbi:hypothetical protein A7A08_00475 [Methyloligella halotolerans]|uniref:Uncharacterized protein n=1 Tax=Methyloligella halotolerans TaxID=1177755 RepID=A0A1E2S2H7_9HYPH|nr:hypothetical protein [Methyloligella halotolerans]ODA68644.1 hypothetical protein A7A08_00475 [Methyloligella halotolerans]
MAARSHRRLVLRHGGDGAEQLLDRAQSRVDAGESLLQLIDGGFELGDLALLGFVGHGVALQRLFGRAIVLRRRCSLGLGDLDDLGLLQDAEEIGSGKAAQHDPEDRKDLRKQSPESARAILHIHTLNPLLFATRRIRPR